MKRFDLRKLRRDHKLTQKQLADILGCEQSFISIIETGKGTYSRDLPQEKFNILVDRYGDLSAYISNYEEEKEEEKSANNISEYSAYKSDDISRNSAYVMIPEKILEELTKLTETIHSQQRTIECLVNNKPS